METKNIINILIIVIILVALGIAVFFFLERTQGVQSGPSAGSSNTQIDQFTGGLATSETAQVLNQISRIKLDSAFFDSAEFVRLRDLTIDVIPEPAGIENPFVPLR